MAGGEFEVVPDAAPPDAAKIGVTMKRYRGEAYGHHDTNGAKKRETTKASAFNWQEHAMTAAKLQRMKFEPVRYIIPGIVPEGLSLFTGKPKIGKSWSLLDWCLGIAGDVPVMGGIRAQSGDVLYLALEDNNRRLQKRLAKLRGINMTNAVTWPEG